MLTKEDVVKELNGTKYPLYPTEEQKQSWKDAGLVVVYGASDDLCELAGAIYDEQGAPGEVLLNRNGTIFEYPLDCDSCEDCRFVQKEKENTVKLLSAWDKEGYSFIFHINVPYATFDIIDEDDGSKYCRGIVFSLDDLRKA